ncbi:hypothetical protein FGG08_000676 [Glutinoglossum americanum]|uniref:Zf-C3HC-domain-containing protein n=1 Tax=Glutinoglossum americanum TaxID=1670608 RepID=A0A9P8I9S2_9PEZI|nr:hypothetical protein FGG08_000676 [Glutinoglossum americanum]
MYATKRKFHNILSSLTGNGSTTSLSGVRQSTNASTTTLPADIESRSKKRRVIARPRSEIASRADRPKTSDAPAAAATQSSLEHKPVPNYAPWDRNQFLQRLKTFRHVDKWSAKPTAVNEVQWARRGWSCVGKEMVRCVGGCGKEALVKLETERSSKIQHMEEGENEEDEGWDVGVGEEIVRRYADMIITEHDESCLWRVRGCDETIYRLPLARPPISLAALGARYTSLVAMAGDLPSTLSTPDTLDIQHLTKQVPIEFLHSYSPSPLAAESPLSPNKTLNHGALILALFGWQAETGHIAGLATCEACFRRLGLWLFKVKPSEDASMSRLDVVGEHREYCPWINSIWQNGGSSPKKQKADISDQKPGWEILVRVLEGALHLQLQVDDPAAAPSLLRSDNNKASGDIVARGRSENTASRDEQDNERWARLKKLKKVFDVRSRKKAASKAL